MTRRRLLLEALVLGGGLALFAWRELAAMRVDGATRDEPEHLAYGERGLREGVFDRERDILNSKMPVSVLNALPVAAAARHGVLDAGRRLWLARLPTVLLGAVLGALVFLWGRELFGFPGGALALFLYTFCPNVLAHSHLVTTDVATSLGMFAATFAFWRYRRQPGPTRLAVAAAAFGAAQLTKATAVFLVPIFMLIVAVERLRLGRGGRRSSQAGGGAEDGKTGASGEARGARRRWAAVRAVAAMLAPGAALGAAALLALNLGFAGEKTLTPLSRYAPVSRPFRALQALPVVRDLPVPLPLPYLAGIDMVTRDARAGSPSYFHGRFGYHGFWNYFLVATLIKVPLGTLALLALAAWLAATGRVRAPDADAFLLVPAAFLFAYLSFAFELQIGLRYLLPAFPFLFVFAGRAAAWKPLASWHGAAVGLLAAWTAVSSFSVHPHYIPYFNELIGGPRNGYRWLLGSNVDWGQDETYMREVYGRRSRVRVWIEPSGPIAGRVAVGVSDLGGRLGLAGRRRRPLLLRGARQPCLRQPARPRARAPRHPAAPVLSGGRGFGIAWDRPREIGRMQAYPGFRSRGPASHQFLATDYVLQWWDGSRWLDLPGTRVGGNTRTHVEHGFPPVRTTRVRLLIERERNQRATEEAPDVFRAACLELAAYRR